MKRICSFRYVEKKKEMGDTNLIAAERDNDRSIWIGTNANESTKPLMIFIPQWAKASLDLMPRERQEMIYSEFVHDIGVAFEKLLREG